MIGRGPPASCIKLWQCDVETGVCRVVAFVIYVGLTVGVVRSVLVCVVSADVQQLKQLTWQRPSILVGLAKCRQGMSSRRRGGTCILPESHLDCTLIGVQFPLGQ